MVKKSDYSDNDYEDYKYEEEEEIQIEGERSLRIKELDLNTLHPLNPGDIKNGVKYAIIGKPSTGKSSLIDALLYSKKHIIPVFQIFSGTEDSNGFYGQRIPESFIYNGLDVDNLEPLQNFNKRQKLARNFLFPRGDNPWAGLVIDDCTYDTKFLKKPIVKEIYKNGRHRLLFYILSLQYAMDIGPDIRTAIDGTFIMKENNPSMRKKLWENYGAGIETLADFNDIMDQITGDYTALYINNKGVSNNVEDNLFYFRADLSKIPKDFKLGCRDYWSFHEDRFNHNYTPSF